MSKSENNSDVDIHFNAGDIILIKKVEDTTVFKEGDVIAFMSTNSDSYGETVTHMVRSVRKNSAGRVIGYITYGTNTGATDEALVEPEYVLGEYTGKLSGVGIFFNFLRSSRGYVTFILIPLLLLIVYNGVNVILLSRRYKKERATEKKQNEELLLELKTLKEQLANQGGNVQSAANTEESSDT
jgi:signal peptidase